MKPKDWYLRVMVTLLAVGVWVLILKPVLAPTAKTVRAHKFELVDREGKVWAEFVAFAFRGPSLHLMDGQGNRVAGLWVTPDHGGGLTLADGQGRERAFLRVLPNGRPALCMWDAQGTTRMVLGGTDRLAPVYEKERPESSLVLLDKDRKVISEVP